MARMFTNTKWDSIAELKDALIEFGKDIPTKDKTEIERKWLVLNGPAVVAQFNIDQISQVSDLKWLKIKQVVNSYVSTDPEIRIRATYNSKFELLSYKVAYKGPADEDGLERIELEFDTTEEIYNRLLTWVTCSVMPFRGSTAIQRKIWIARYGNLEYELKCADQGNDWQLEIEFPDRETANKFVLPPEFDGKIGADVTADPSYKIKEYWKRTRQQITLNVTPLPQPLYTALVDNGWYHASMMPPVPPTDMRA